MKQLSPKYDKVTQNCHISWQVRTEKEYKFADAIESKIMSTAEQAAPEGAYDLQKSVSSW